MTCDDNDDKFRIRRIAGKRRFGPGNASGVQRIAGLPDGSTQHTMIDQTGKFKR